MFATTLAQPAVIKLPLQNLLKTDLHVAPEGMAFFFAVAALAWYFKPLAGIQRDFVTPRILSTPSASGACCMRVRADPD